MHEAETQCCGGSGGGGCGDGGRGGSVTQRRVL